MENVIKVLQNDSHKEFYDVTDSIEVEDNIVFKFTVLETVQEEDVDGYYGYWPSEVKLLSVNGQEPTQEVSDLFKEVLATKWAVWLEPKHME